MNNLSTSNAQRLDSGGNCKSYEHSLQTPVSTQFAFCTSYPLKFHFDLEDFNKPYPCGHSILKVEGELIDANTVLE